MAAQRTEQAWYRRHRPAVRTARLEARKVAEKWGLPEVADTLESAVAELVGNSIVHGQAGQGSHVAVTYRLLDQCLRVEVRDAASGMPRLIPAATEVDDLPEGGRGLALVAALSYRWGVIPHVIGKSVWFEVLREPSSPTVTA